MPSRLTLQPAQIRIRHVYRPDLFNPARSSDNAQTILGKTYAPSMAGINGPRGFQDGQYERRLNQEGTFTLTFPNAAGEDGILHRSRFLILQNGRRTVGGSFYSYTGGSYRPGDEWIEVYRVTQGGVVGDLLFIGTPTQATVSQSQIQLTGTDAFWLLRKTRETSTGFIHLSPRDAIDYYTSAWQPVLIEDFNKGQTFSNSGYTDVTTADGRLDSRKATSQNSTNPPSGTVRVGPVDATNTLARVRSTATIPFGLSAATPDTWATWRTEATFVLSTFANLIQVGLWDYSLNQGVYSQIGPPLVAGLGGSVTITSQGYTARNVIGTTVGATLGSHSLAIEGRGRWCYFFLDNQMIGVQPMPNINGAGRAFFAYTYSSDTTSTIDLDVLALRRTRPFLLRGSNTGDYAIGGAPTPGGLVGSYFDDHDMTISPFTATDRPNIALNGTRTPAVKRLDPNMSMTGTTWTPPTMLNSYFSVRWTGSVYLDLAASDYFMRWNSTSGSAGDRTQLHVGKTRLGEGFASDVSTGSLRTALESGYGGAGQPPYYSGWFPVVLEYVVSTQSPNGGTLQISTNNSTWSTVTSNILSPLGVYEDNVRFESHYDQVGKIAESFALQFTCVPKQLESGLFPGELVPKVRVGRDTEKTLDILEATSIQVDLDAQQVCDSLTADAQGIADPGSVTQVIAEAFNFLEVENHLLLHQEYESMSEVSILALLQQRLASELLLRGSAWEQVSAMPAGFREFLDQFPLTGSLAEFAWEPGDAIRIWLGEIGVEDRSPRQILGVQRPFKPDGLGRPTVSFRQRPRDLGDMIRGILQTQLRDSRNYQGQLVMLSGNVAATSGLGDTYSRVSIPVNVSTISRATLVIQTKSDGSSWNVEINGTNRLTLSLMGRYDVTAYALPFAAGSQVMQVRLTGGTGVAQYSLELLVSV